MFLSKSSSTVSFFSTAGVEAGKSVWALATESLTISGTCEAISSFAVFFGI
jgi:hypothetical protein